MSYIQSDDGNKDAKIDVRKTQFKLDCDVNIIPMQVEESCNTSFVFLITWWSSYYFVVVSLALPSEFDLSW